LLVTLDRTNLLQLSTQVGPVVQQARAGGKDVLDYATQYQAGLDVIHFDQL